MSCEASLVCLLPMDCCSGRAFWIVGTQLRILFPDVNAFILSMSERKMSLKTHWNVNKFSVLRGMIAFEAKTHLTVQLVVYYKETNDCDSVSKVGFVTLLLEAFGCRGNLYMWAYVCVCVSI